MPIYEYKCSKCGKVFEVTQRISEDAFTKCPKEICEMEVKGEGDVHRLISKNVGLIFNGSGFYLTDYTNRKSSAAPAGHQHHHSEAPACGASTPCAGCTGDVSKTA